MGVQSSNLFREPGTALHSGEELTPWTQKTAADFKHQKLKLRTKP